MDLWLKKREVESLSWHFFFFDCSVQSHAVSLFVASFPISVSQVQFLLCGYHHTFLFTITGPYELWKIQWLFLFTMSSRVFMRKIPSNIAEKAEVDKKVASSGFPVLEKCCNMILQHSSDNLLGMAFIATP